MKFAKMQGCGNDYVYINGFEEIVDADKKPELVRKLSERHFGIGSDGVIFINPSDIADFEMEMYNADGSRSEMCGNGIRCVAKYVYDKKMTSQKEFTIESFGKVKNITIIEENGKAKLIKVGMGKPELRTEKIPAIYDSETIIAKPIEVEGNIWDGTCVSMGNPHVVMFVDEVKDMDLKNIGPKFENHPMFPNRTNAEFVKVIDEATVEMRVWERGTGETLACGTGCCATAVACILNGKTGNKVLVKVLGGEILVEWNQETNEIYMTGPGEFVFEGEILSI